MQPPISASNSNTESPKEKNLTAVTDGQRAAWSSPKIFTLDGQLTAGGMFSDPTEDSIFSPSGGIL